MAASSLSDKLMKPDDEMLAMVLADTKPLWDGVINHIASMHEKPGEEWKFYGTKSGWTLAAFGGKRRLINMIPKLGYFQAIFTLGEKAAAAVRNSDLPEAVKALLPNETQCVCGYGMVLDMRTSRDLEAAKKLLEIKDKN